MTEPDVVVKPRGEDGTPGEKLNNRREVIEVQTFKRTSMPQEYAPMPQNEVKKHWFAMRVPYSR